VATLFKRIVTIDLFEAQVGDAMNPYGDGDYKEH
jgi:hypothetical protein